MSKPDLIKTIVFTADPKIVETLINHVANGGSAIDLCKIWNIRYSDMMKTIRSSEDFSKAYSQALIDRTEWARERILKEQQALAMFNIKDTLNPDGTIKKLHDMPDDVTAAIKEIDADGAVKFIDKNKSLDQLHKQLGLFVDKKEVTGSISLERIVLEADKLKD